MNNDHDGPNYATAEFVRQSDNDEKAYSQRRKYVANALANARNDVWYSSSKTYHDGDVLSALDEATAQLTARQEVENWIEECLYAMVPGEGVLCDFAQSLLEMELGNIDAEQIAHEWVNQAVVEGK